MKVIGYVVAVVGLVVIVLGSGFFGEIGFVEDNFLYVSGAGVLLVVIGAAMSLVAGKGKGKQGSEEVPIYEGVGKKRKVVGYQRG